MAPIRSTSGPKPPAWEGNCDDQIDPESAATASLAAIALSLAACGSDDVTPPTPLPAPTPTPTGTPTPTPQPTTGFNVSNCINQVIPGTGGVTVAGAVIPDTLTINLDAPSGFPNGRRLEDPVIDVTLAVLFLDLATHGADTFARLPLGPAANDRPFLADFPFMAAPNGTQVAGATGGTNFAFNNSPASSFVRVDRMGMPAVATVLIGSGLRNSYNDASTADDVDGDFVPELGARLTVLTNALADDLGRAGLTPCATPIAPAS
ncbi:MAG: DUF4331 domain-containing protein [Rhizobiales bacterium]|nr:DUF4331 domain-containing protein [Hyphomicrobiales bacterium]